METNAPKNYRVLKEHREGGEDNWPGDMSGQLERDVCTEGKWELAWQNGSEGRVFPGKEATWTRAGPEKGSEKVGEEA